MINIDIMEEGGAFVPIVYTYSYQGLWIPTNEAVKAGLRFWGGIGGMSYTLDGISRCLLLVLGWISEAALSYQDNTSHTPKDSHRNQSLPVFEAH